MTTLSFDVLWRDRGATRGMRDLGDTTEKTGRRFNALKVTGAAALAAVGAGAVKFAASSVRAYVEAEQSQVRLESAYRRFPKVADVSLSSLQRLNSELARKTRFDDDATASGQAVLAQFRLTGTQITQLTPLLQDYAAKTGKDLPSAARDLGRAVMGQGRALKGVGLNLKDTGSETGNLNQLMAGLRTQVGGFAEQEGKTAAGRAEILKNQFGELQEEAGQRLLPALMKVGAGLLRVVNYVQDSNGVFGSFRRIIGATFGEFSKSLGGGRSAMQGFSDLVSTNQANITRGFVTAAKVALGIGRAILTTASGALRGYAMIADGQADMTENVVGSMRSILRGASIAFGWIPGVGEKIKAADARFASFSDTAVGGLRRAATGARGAADTVDRRLIPALDASGRKLDEVARKEIVKAATRDAVNKATIAVRDLGTRSDGTQVRLKRFSDITRLSAGEQRAFKIRLDTVSSSLRTKMERMRAAGASSSDMRREVIRSRDALFREFRQMGMSNEEARKLATRYARVPDKVETRVTQPGMKGRGGALESTSALDRRINDLNDKRVNIRFGTNAADIARRYNVALVTRGRQAAGRGLQSGSGPGHGSLDASVGPPVPGPGHDEGGPTVSRTIRTNTGRMGVEGVPRTVSRIGDDVALGVGRHLGAALQKRLGDVIAASDTAGAPGGRVATRNVGAGWGPIQAAMRRHGARTFNTYPGHHPSMAMARDVYPHNWAAANAARALSSVWYVIYRMKIASKNHGNTWRQYRPTNFRGDWRHVRHIHVARRYDSGGMMYPGQIGINTSARPERVLTDQQNQAWERLTRVVERRGSAGNSYQITLHAPIGAQADLRNNLMQMARRGDIDVIVNQALRR